MNPFGDTEVKKENINPFGDTLTTENVTPEMQKSIESPFARVTAPFWAGSEKALASTLGSMADLADIIARVGGVEKEDRKDALFRKLSDEFAERSDYWQQVMQAQGTKGVEQLVGSVLGQLPFAGFEWSLGVPAAALKGVAEAEAEDKGISGKIKKGAVEGAKRYILGKILGAISSIKAPLTRRGLGAATLGTSTAIEGGDTADIATSAVLGAILTGYHPKTTPQPEVVATGKPEALRGKPEGVQRLPTQTEYTAQKPVLQITDIMNRPTIQQAIKGGKKVPFELVKPYKGEPWADTYLKSLGKEVPVKMGDGWYEKIPVKQVPKGTPIIKTPSQSEIDNIRTKVTNQIKNLKDLRKTVADPAIKELRAKQAQGFKETLDIELSKGTPADRAIKIARSKFKQTADVPKVTPPQLSDAEWDTISRKIVTTYKDSFSITNAQEAVDGWRAGKIIQPSQFKYIADIFGENFTKDLYYKYKALTPLNTWDYVKGAVQLAKAPFSLDVQFFRQASTTAMRNPVKYAKGGAKALKSYVSEKYAEKLNKITRNDPIHSDAKEHGLNFLKDVPWGEGSSPEQFILGQPFAERLVSTGLTSKSKLVKSLTAPLRGAGKWYLASERSMIASLNNYMQELYKLPLKSWQAKGITGDQLSSLKANRADAINKLVKLYRLKSPSGRQIQSAANFIVFSPSMTISRPAQLQAMLANTGSRKYLAENIASNIGGIFLISAITKIIGDRFKDKKGNPIVTSELDPRSTNWGVIVKGRERYDLGGGDIQFYRTIARLVTGEIKNQAGEIKSIPRQRILEQYATSRQTALLGVVNELRTGKTAMGDKIWEVPDWDRMAQEEGGPLKKPFAKVMQKLTQTEEDKKAYLATKFAAQHLIPQFLGAVFEAGLNQGWASMFTRGTTEFFSQATTDYPQSQSTKTKILKNDLSQQTYGVYWDNLTQDQQEDLRAANPEIEQAEQATRFEFREREEPFEIKAAPLPISESIKRELKKLQIPTPQVSRIIRSNWSLNDKRYKKYQQITAKYIDENLSNLFQSDGWDKLPDDYKTDAIAEEVTLAKEWAREDIENLAQAEMEQR